MTSPNPARLNPNDPNVAMLEVVAARLGPDLCRELVFVGGAVAGLLITDTAQPAIRPTEDVDLLAQVLARPDYYALEEAMRSRGFAQDLRQGAPICRWVVERQRQLLRVRRWQLPRRAARFVGGRNQLAAHMRQVEAMQDRVQMAA